MAKATANHNQVLIEVHGGVAEVVRKPGNVEVVLRDYDVDNCQDLSGGNLPAQTDMLTPNEEYAERLIRENRILDGAKALRCSYHLSPSLRPKPTCAILSFLFDHCSFEQRQQVSYLMDEFAVPLPPSVEAELRTKEYAMYVKFHDPDGIAKCLRRLEALDNLER